MSQVNHELAAMQQNNVSDFSYENLSETLKEEPSLEILVEMSQSGEIDPWDVDLEIVTGKFLDKITDSITNNLKEAGKIIFFASTLLRMKSDILSMKASQALTIGQDDLDDDMLIEEELASFDTREVKFTELDRAIIKKSVSKKKRYRKISLEDLLIALKDAQKEEEKRETKRIELAQFASLADMDIFIEPEIESDDLLELTHAENIEEAIEKSRAYLAEYLVNGHGVKFSNLCKFLRSWSNAFLSILFLAHENEVKIIQQEFYGELWIYESEK